MKQVLFALIFILKQPFRANLEENRFLSNKKTEILLKHFGLLCDPGGARTLDPLIKSQLLYQLSYGVAFPLFAVQG